MPFPPKSRPFSLRPGDRPSAHSKTYPWFRAGLLLIFLVSLALRFWGLSRFNELVFDEVYYANFAAGYLRGEQQFGGHPPLSNYLIAFGIAVAQRFGWGDPNLSNSLTGTLLTTFSYRWLNALTGSFVPLVMAAIAFQLTRRRSYALIAALFTAADGLLLVESRYALNNIYLVLFGLLGHWFLLRALHIQNQRSPGQRYGAAPFWVDLTLAGIGFGGAIAIKWNGAGFLLGAGVLWAIAYGLHRLPAKSAPPASPLSPSPPLSSPPACPTPLLALPRLHPFHIGYSLVLVPAVTYALSWLPYMQLDWSKSFWAWQAEVLSYHERVGGMDAHPYCSPWYSWPWMVRPVAYFYQTTQTAGNPPTEVIYDVHAMGNPFLWWFSSLAMLFTVGAIALWLWHALRAPRATPAAIPPTENFYPLNLLLQPGTGRSQFWIMLFFVVNWATNWLPWIKVSRCVFLYHYMGASLFALLSLAWIVDLGLRKGTRSSPFRQTEGAIASTVILVLVLLAFVFWMPFYLGLPLDPLGLQLRRWLPTWI